jgi:hypothetical protein
MPNQLLSREVKRSRLKSAHPTFLTSFHQFDFNS